MSREAMKLALGVLSGSWRTEEEKNALREKQIQAVIALREALAKPDFWEGYVPEPDKRQQALDKKAENARELGLDYEPVCNKDPQGCWNVRCQLGKKCKNTPAQRTWVGLTDEERDDLLDNYITAEGRARAIEAKLKEKNT